MFSKIALVTLGCALLAASSHAAPAMRNLPVGPSYLGFVASDNLDTLNIATPNKTREKLGTPMSIYFGGTPKLQNEIKNGYATMFATWAQTTLRVPLGWVAVDSTKNVDESLVVSPGQTVAIVARAAIDNSKYQIDRDAFAKLKTASVGQTRVRLQKMGFVPGPIERLDLADGSFAVRVPRMLDRDGEAFSYLERFSQRATQTERDVFWAQVAAKEPVSPLPLPLAMSLRTTPAKFNKYLPLLGLMARDEGLNWNNEQSYAPADFAANVPNAARFVAVADEAVALLKAGDIKGFQARFPLAFEGRDRAATAKYLGEIAVPFFAKLPAKTMRENVTVNSDRDPKTPLLRVTMRRDFELGPENFPSYVVAMERVNGAIRLLGVATTDDPFPH